MKFDTFDTKQAENTRYKSECGSKYLDQYEYRVNEKGVRELKKTDKKENVYARIQADYDATDINKLMARFALGDSSALDQRAGFYGDATKLPTTYAEMFDRVEQCKQFFDSLPTDLKQSFDNSYEVYFATYGTKEFMAKYDDYNARFKNTQFDAPGSTPADDPKGSSSTEYTEVER